MIYFKIIHFIFIYIIYCVMMIIFNDLIQEFDLISLTIMVFFYINHNP